MGEIKSAWEKAMEKVEQLGKPSEDELKRLEHIPTGNSLAGKYLFDEKYDLDKEFSGYKGSGIRQYILQGIMEILLRNISLPHDDRGKYIALRALQGIRIVKDNKKGMDTVIDQIKNLLNYYEQARAQRFTQFKGQFESKLKESGIMMQQQTAQSAAMMEMQIQQRFQEEWRNSSRDLDMQYERALEEQKQQIQKLN
jgi:hypothetical protein